ncbi:MAG: DUF2845 domain-containing protein [Salinisphaeraceae bacterium]|nr:DUF2845 domain-containing protein [Salinisphaeraceae bacterium]
MRCDRRIVSEQDSMFEVQARCGDPALRDRHPPVNAYGQGYFGYPEETWYYNFGPNRLLHVLEFRNKRLVKIRTDGYGFVMPENTHCLPGDIHRSMSKLRLVAECGEPNQQEHYYQLVPQFRHGYIAGHVGVLREIWLFNFGPRRLLHEVILEDGYVTDVKARTEHGY